MDTKITLVNYLAIIAELNYKDTTDYTILKFMCDILHLQEKIVLDLHSKIDEKYTDTVKNAIAHQKLNSIYNHSHNIVKLAISMIQSHCMESNIKAIYELLSLVLDDFDTKYTIFANEIHS